MKTKLLLFLFIFFLQYCYAQDTTYQQLKQTANEIFLTLARNNISKLQVDNFTDVNQSQNKLTSYIQDLTKNLLYENSNTSNGKLVIVNNPNKKNEPQAFLSGKVIYFPNKYQVAYTLKDKDGNEFFSKMPDITRTDELKSQESNLKTETSISSSKDSTIAKSNSVVPTKPEGETKTKPTPTYNQDDPCAKNNTGTICFINKSSSAIEIVSDEDAENSQNGYPWGKHKKTLTIESNGQECFYEIKVGSHSMQYHTINDDTQTMNGQAFVHSGDSRFKTKQVNVQKCSTEENSKVIELR